MKIGYFSCSRKFGGIEKIVVDTLNELVKTNDCLLIVPFGCEFKYKLDKKIEVLEYKSYDKRYNPFLYLEIIKNIKSCDIVHTHGAKATQISYILSKFISFNHIATKHNSRKGKIFNKVKNVISVSKKVSKTITHNSKVIYFGLDYKEQNSQQNSKFTMVAVGRLDPIKGFDNLINELSKLDFDFELNIIGEGNQKSQLNELIKSKNLEGKIKLIGFKDNIPSYLINSNIQLISSLSEGLPITLIEGLLYSPIIISTPVGGIVEVLDKDYLLNIEQFPKKINDIYMNFEKEKKNFSIKHEKIKKSFDKVNYINSLMKYYKGILDEKTS